MPFAITLDKALEADGEIKTSFTVRDYHFHLSSIAPNHQSAIYTLRHDPFGTGITYLGYLMLLICSIIHFSNSALNKTSKTANSLCRSSKPSIRNLSFLLPPIIIIPIAYCIHWFYYGRMPLSNGYEVMLLLSLCILATGIIAFKNDRSMLRTSIMASLAIFAATLIFMDSSAGPLPPVLNSPLLYLHVITIIIAYALLTTITIISVRHLFNHHQSLPHPHLLTTGVLLLAIGIFLGAVWANVSWGRYWGWDPKEVWALITMLIYAFALHSDSIKVLRRPMVFHLFCILAFLSVLITYFGVNFFLGGMHSYA
ncbi:MAG: cytochrome c biogenesis protein CcsA [Prevotella sp.]|nr:cytochrome c biogenesis protein CcsA [Prevotella sp.]